MTFDPQQPFTQGYGNIVNQSGKVLGQIPGLEHTMRIRFAGEGLRQAAEDRKLDYLLKAQKYGMQPQQSQGGTDWLGLAKTGIGLIGGLGGFGGGGSGSGGISFADGMNLGLPSFGDYSGIPSGGWGIPFG